MHPNAALIDGVLLRVSRARREGDGRVLSARRDVPRSGLRRRGARRSPTCGRCSASAAATSMLDWRDVRADDAEGFAHWEPRYTFSVTGRPGPQQDRIALHVSRRQDRHASRLLQPVALEPHGARPQGRGARLDAVREEGDPGEARRGFDALARATRRPSPVAHGPEPPFTHDRTPRIGILLTNLGTPDAPTTGAVRRYLAQFLSDPRVIEIAPWAWKPLLHGVDPQHAPVAIGEALPGDLDQGRLAAARAQHPPADAAAGLSRPAAEARRLSVGPVPGRDRHALRQPEHRRRRSTSCARTAVREDAGAAVVSAVRGEHDGVHARRRRRAFCARAPAAGAAVRGDVPRRRRLHQGAGAERQRLLDEARTAGQARAVVPRRAAPHARRRRSVPLLLPRHRAPARARARARARRSGRCRSSRDSAARSGSRRIRPTS